VSIPDITDIDAQVGAAIRTERMRAGLKQEELATAVGIDRTTLSRYESGSRSVPIGLLVQIAYVLRAPLSEIVPGARPMEQAWGTGQPPLTPGLVTITRVIAERPDLAPQMLEFLSLLIERDMAAPEGSASGDEGYS
jgi:transcriptional regulator with XRE-family HTH domain